MNNLSLIQFEKNIQMSNIESVLYISFGHLLLKENRTGIHKICIVNWKNTGINGIYAIVINRKLQLHYIRLYKVDSVNYFNF